MDKETRKIMDEILHWMLIGAKIKLAEAKKQVTLHEKFIKDMEEKKEIIEKEEFDET